MTREEQIKKQADIYTDDASNYTEWSDDGGWSNSNDIDLIEKAFIEGAKWADNNPKSLQISVKNDLPCNHEELTHSNYTDRVIVLARNEFPEVELPKAIDVYRDKTTLEITYKDNVSIDTVVVWKDK